MNVSTMPVSRRLARFANRLGIMRISSLSEAAKAARFAAPFITNGARCSKREK
jgi:hypothetical protein